MSVPTRRRGVVLLAGAGAAALLLAACGGSSTSDESTSAAPASSSADGGATSAAPAAGCEAYAAYGTFEGASVTLFTSILPPEQQKFEAAWAEFEECTGIDIVYEGSDQFEAQLPTRIAGGNAPDLAFIPQPGLLAKLVESGGPITAPDSVTALVDQYWNPAWKAYGTVDGTFYAAPLGSNMKSFVWYSPKVFADKGYTVPTTWDELFALSDQMVADGVKPWCGGIEPGGATGWPATDWVEDIMLRTQTPDVYDAWTTNEMPFNDPRVVNAIEVFGSFARNDAYVAGGAGAVATTDFRDSPAGLFASPPGCYMHR
ncbi:MAG: ABC transporter substrate-binding protein, partial [Miltoncostaeaceae bacterium]